MGSTLLAQPAAADALSKRQMAKTLPSKGAVAKTFDQRVTNVQHYRKHAFVGLCATSRISLAVVVLDRGVVRHYSMDKPGTGFAAAASGIDRPTESTTRERLATAQRHWAEECVSKKRVKYATSRVSGRKYGSAARLFTMHDIRKRSYFNDHGLKTTSYLIGSAVGPHTVWTGYTHKQPRAKLRRQHVKAVKQLHAATVRDVKKRLNG